MRGLDDRLDELRKYNARLTAKCAESNWKDYNTMRVRASVKREIGKVESMLMRGGEDE